MRLSKWEKTTWPQIPVFPISIIVFCFPQRSNYKKHSLLILLIYNGGERYRNCARLPARLHRQSAFIFPGRFWAHGQKKTVSVLNSHCIVQTIFTLKYTEAKIKKWKQTTFHPLPPQCFQVVFMLVLLSQTQSDHFPFSSEWHLLTARYEARVYSFM